MESKINDVYSRVTNQIIEAIEAGADGWRMPWHVTDSGQFFPTNALSKKPYRGVNVLGVRLLIGLWCPSPSFHPPKIPG
jgi:antirestriction protein ArdC